MQARDRDEDADEGPSSVKSGNNTRRNSLDRSSGRSRSNSIEDLAERGRRASLEEDRLHSHQGIVHSIDDVGHWTDPRGRTSLDDQRGRYTFQTFERSEKPQASTPTTTRSRSNSKSGERTSLSGQRTSLTGRRPSVSGPQAMPAKPSTGAPKNMVGDIQVKFKIEHEKKKEKKGPSLFELLNVDDQPSGKEGEVSKTKSNTNANPEHESKESAKKEEGHHHHHHNHHKHAHEDKQAKDKKAKGPKAADMPLGGGDLPRGAISLHLIAQKGLKEDVKRALKESNAEIKLNAKTGRCRSLYPLSCYELTRAPQRTVGLPFILQARTGTLMSSSCY